MKLLLYGSAFCILDDLNCCVVCGSGEIIYLPIGQVEPVVHLSIQQFACPTKHNFKLFL